MPERVLTRFDSDDEKEEAVVQSKSTTTTTTTARIAKNKSQPSKNEKHEKENSSGKENNNKKRKREEKTSPQHHSQKQNVHTHIETAIPNTKPRSSLSSSYTTNYENKHNLHSNNKKKTTQYRAPQPRNNISSSSSSFQQPLKEKARILFETRKNLPIFPHADEIRRHLRKSNVMLLIGETGSGKSTQIPQFLVDEDWCQAKKVKAVIASSAPAPSTTITTTNTTNTSTPTLTPTPTQEDSGSKKKMPKNRKEITVGGCVAITQPRRVAAISLARRVAEEMGTPLGKASPASRVGYSVRFDTSVSPSTRVKFLTDGMLLQEMLHDPWLTKYSVVVVDEVHERGVNVDLVLGFLKNILASKNEGRGGVPLKVVVMSATADMESLQDFFDEAHKGEEEEAHQEKIEKSSEHDKNDDDGGGGGGGGGDGNSAAVSTCHIKGRQFPVQTIYSPAPVHDFVDAALETIFNIHIKEPMPGDILVFLTGQETVENLEYLVNEYAVGMDPSLPKVLALPLFAALPQAAQQRVFAPAPPRTRKIILATNIAETSVTVSGVRFVVDCGKAKMKQFRSRLGLDSLLVKPISKSAAIQRKGRAGREAAGKCYRLYTERDYLALDEANTPEILRSDLSQSLLTMKARGVEDIINFPFLTKPPREALEKALLQLFNIQALEETGKISAIGLQIAKLPLTPPLGRVLLAAAGYGQDCLLHVIDIISCLSVENIFLNTTSEEKKEEAEKARRDLYRREGDHLTMLSTVQGYAAENTNRKAWAERHMVSHRAMQSVMDVRKQLTSQCKQAKLLIEEEEGDATGSERRPPPDAMAAVSILKSFLTGFSTNTARLVPDGSYRTVVGNQTVAIHPSSVLFGKRVEAIMYNEFVFTNRSYARGVSAVQMDWVGEVLAG